MKLSTLRHCAAIILATLLLASCSSKDALDNVIPADAQIVVRANVEKIAKELNVTIKDGAVELPPELNAQLSGSQLKSLASFAQAIDLTSCNFYMLSFTDGNPMAVATVKDMAKLQDLLKENQYEKKLSQGGYDVYGLGSNLVVVRETTVWVPSVQSSPEQAIEKIKSDVKMAEERSIADVKAVETQLNQDNLINVAYLNPMLGDENADKDGGVYGVMGVTIKDNELLFTSASRWADNSPFTFEGMTDINTPVLQYIPANANFAFGAGLSDKINWDSMLKPYVAVVGLAYQAQLQIVVEYLKMLDGTVMGAAGLDGEWSMAGINNPQAYNFILMAHMKQENLDQTLGQVSALASQAGMTVADEGDGLRSVVFDGVKLYFGSTDGYFTVASRKPANNQGNAALTANFNGKQNAFALSLPSLAIFNPGLNFGLEIRAEGSGSEGKATIAFPGTDAPVLATLIKCFSLK